MRKSLKWNSCMAICLVVLFAGLIPAAAQSAPPEAMPSVDQILDKYVAALGGKEAIQKITTRVAKGTFAMEQMPGDATTEIYQKAPDKIFTDTESPSFGVYKRGYNGTVGWQDTPQTGLADVTGSQLADMKRGADLYGDIHLKELYPKMTLKGKESVDGHDAYVIAATAKDGSPETWYFDVDSGLKVRNQSQAEGPNGPVDVDTKLGDYREVDGVKFPFLLHQSFGEFAFTIKLTDVKQNVPIDDAKFDKPAAQP
jgi:outer membrane lipoprotein-sorting protein